MTLDEVQTISFKDTDELRAALKGFLENGIYTVGNHSNNADAGVKMSVTAQSSTSSSRCPIKPTRAIPPRLNETCLSNARDDPTTACPA